MGTLVEKRYISKAPQKTDRIQPFPCIRYEALLSWVAPYLTDIQRDFYTAYFAARAARPFEIS